MASSSCSVDAHPGVITLSPSPASSMCQRKAARPVRSR